MIIPPDIQQDIALFREHALQHAPKGDPTWRSDWPLIKHLSQTHSPEVARAWQRLPLIQMPLDSVDRLAEFQTAVAQHDHEACWPFQDFVLDLWQLDYDIGEKILHTWIRFSQIESYMATRHVMSPWDISIDRRIAAKYRIDFSDVTEALRHSSFVVESWTTFNGVFYHTQTSPQGIAIYTGSDRPFNPCRDGCSPYPISELTASLIAQQIAPLGLVDTEEMISTFMRETWESDIVSGVLMALSLSLRPEYLVQETPITEGTPRKPKDPKPWTNSRLPRYILLEPGNTGLRQHNPQGGTHASPRPHQRRGSWRTLRHSKFHRNPDGSYRQVFVKPSWIGPEEWVSEGNRYKVVLQGEG